MSEIIISLKDLRKTYHMGHESLEVLKGISLDIHRSEYVAIVGSSGSGKSTLLNILGCLDTSSNGGYCLAGQNIQDVTDEELAEIRNKHIGFIFQSFNLIPSLDALSNVMLPLLYARVPFNERKARAEHMLKQVGLGERMRHLPNEMSGGQRQRVAIARALVTNPELLLADEPTGNLDSSTTDEILDLFDELHQRGHTIVMVTHEPDVAQRCQREIRLHDGRVLHDKWLTPLVA